MTPREKTIGEVLTVLLAEQERQVGGHLNTLCPDCLHALSKRGGFRDPRQVKCMTCDGHTLDVNHHRREAVAYCIEAVADMLDPEAAAKVDRGVRRREGKARRKDCKGGKRKAA